MNAVILVVDILDYNDLSTDKSWSDVIISGISRVPVNSAF